MKGQITMEPKRPSIGDGPLTLNMGQVLKISNDQMHKLRQLNHHYHLERSPGGDLVISNQPSEEANWRNSKLFLTMVSWAIKEHTGLVFEAGTCFVLPNGAMRVPSLSWVKKARLVKIAIKKKQYQYLPLCPDFVLETCSFPEELEGLRLKMHEYVENGAQMAWLLNPEKRTVYIYEKGGPEICLKNPSSISGAPVLKGFSLHPDSIWRADILG